MNTFYIGLKDCLLIIRETEHGYDFIQKLKGKKLNRLAFDPSDRGRLFVASEEGLWRSLNHGEDWERIDHELAPEIFTAVAISTHQNDAGNHTIFVGTEPSRLYYSKDLGVSWNELKGIQQLSSKANWAFPPRPETHFIRWIVTSETDPAFLALSIEAGAVICTNDNGATWNDRAEIGPIDVHTLLTHPQTGNTLYAANGGLVLNKSRESYAESYDEGASWIFMSEGLEEHPYLYNFVLHPENPKYRLVSASKSASKAHRQPAYSTIYQKNDDNFWREAAKGLPRKRAFTHHLANDPNDADGFYALNNFGIYYSHGKEIAWEHLNMEWPEELQEMRPYFFVVN